MSDVPIPNSAFRRLERVSEAGHDHAAPVAPVAPELPEPTPEQQRRAEAVAPNRAERSGFAFVESAPPMPDGRSVGQGTHAPGSVMSGMGEGFAQPVVTTTRAGTGGKPRRKNQPSGAKVFIGGPDETIERFRQFHEAHGYAAFHDSLTALMNLAEKALNDGHSPD